MPLFFPRVFSEKRNNADASLVLPHTLVQDRQHGEDEKKELIHQLVWKDLAARYAASGRKPKRTMEPDGAAEPAKPVEQPLPRGWRPVPSRSRPGEISYENVYTFERVSWRPMKAASRTLGKCL